MHTLQHAELVESLEAACNKHPLLDATLFLAHRMCGKNIQLLARQIPGLSYDAIQQRIQHVAAHLEHDLADHR